MVVFACNVCGESLKKNQVEKHYMTKCRQCNVLSCVDCGKEFWGNDYQQHTKCITEDEKYGGKNFKPKPGTNKGEAKQELWIQQVQEAINNTKGNTKLTGLLERLKEYPNIPRKKAKFENFVKNSVRVREQWLIDQVWEAMAANIQKPEGNTSQESGKQESSTNGKTDVKPVEESTDSQSQEEVKKKSKREKKEERKQKQSKKQKKDKKIEDSEESKPKKSKKRKRDETDEEDEEVIVEEKTKKKKKKKRHEEEMEESQEEETTNLDMSQISITTPVRSKFSWEQCIMEVLRKNNNELKTKKLKKKVLNEYLNCYGDKNTKSEEQLWSMFEKKIRGTHGLKIQKERVKLIES